MSISTDANDQQLQEASGQQQTTATQQSIDYDSGVSNGDVDWLFRGKASKKLAKKKPELNKDLNLNFTKPNGQLLPKTSQDSKLTQQIESQQPPSLPEPKPSLDSQLLSQETTTKKAEPLKPAIINAGDVKTRSRSYSDSAKMQIGNTRSRSSSETKPSLSSSAPRPIARRSSEHAPAPSSTPSTSSSSQGNAAPLSLAPVSKIKLFSSISSKFTKPAVAGSSPLSVGSLQQASDGGALALSATPAVKKNQPTPISATPPEQKGLFGLRRRLSVSKGSQPPVLSSTATGSGQRRDSVTSHLVPKKERKSSADVLTTIKLKRVYFALDKLTEDPQQQIPSRNPKRGNVLVPEDILAEPARLSIGIADGSNNVSTAKKQAVDKEELRLACEAQQEALLESQKHAHEAHLAAQRMAKEVSSFKLNSKTSRLKDDPDEEDNFLHTPLHLHNIDNPLHHHIDYFASADQAEDAPLPSEDSDKSEVVQDLPLETIYTRCCHLREILPIPATLKQLKNKSKPLTVLKMLNPKPTLIDILSFSDFLAITPVLTLIFDNVTIDSEMLRIVLSAIANSLYLEKLSLRNVAIDSDGWAYLCKFLTLSKSLIKLDISQQKIKLETPKSMHRSEMNWGLFNNALVQRGGLEELVINGCMLSDTNFRLLIQSGISLSTKRLGVAATNLNREKCECLASWITRDECKCIGLDIAFNDMTGGQLQPFIDSFNENTKLAFFSLNSTNVPVKDCEAMIKTLSKLKNLRFLDLSNIPHCFPAIIGTLAEWLPKFHDLKRIHFELDELTAPELVAIANIFPNCKSIIHASFLGHKDINYATAVALYGAIKLSSIYTLDIDYDLIPEDLSSKIALHLMINMEKSMNKDLHFEYERSDEELMFDGSLITQAVENLLETKTPTLESFQKKPEQYSKEIITKTLVEKTTRVRKDIHKQMDKLFDLRMKGQLSLEGKETLIRFCLLDNSLEKVVNIFEEEELNKTKNVTATLTGPNNGVDEHLHKVSSDILETGPIVSPNMQGNALQNSYFPALQQLQPATTADHPHSVVMDSNNTGEDVPIDKITGRPVLFRKLSHTSEHAKQQEEEEGEFHKWGFYIQNSLFPDAKSQGAPQQQPTAAAAPEQKPQPTVPVAPKKLNVLPTGAELRELILQAKGSQGLSSLIKKFNTDHNQDIKVEDLYNTLIVDHQSQKNNDAEFSDRALEFTSPELRTVSTSRSSPLALFDPEGTVDPGSPRSINSFELDEAYDKLLNEVDKVRSYKN